MQSSTAVHIKGYKESRGVQNFVHLLKRKHMTSASLYTPERESCRGVTGTANDFVDRSNMITCRNSACAL